MKIKRNTRIQILRNKVYGDDSKKDRPLSIRISYAGNSVSVPVSMSVSLDAWDEETKRVKKGTVNSRGYTADVVNREINKVIDTIDLAFKKFEYEERIPSTDELLDAIRLKLGRVKKSSYEKSERVDDALAEYIETVGSAQAWAPGSYKVFYTLRKDLQAYKKNCTFRSLDQGGLSRFLNWLRYEKPRRSLERAGDVAKDKSKKPGQQDEGQEEIGLKDATVSKRINTLKMFLRWARKQGYPVNPDYEDFKPRIRTTNNPVVYLTPTEIKQIREFPIPESRQSLVRARDVLLFLCYSGMRYSDAANLKKTDLYEGFMEITTLKTDDSLRIEYNKTSKKILDKYAAVDLPNGKALPIISNQKTNKAFKELGKMVGIDIPVRRTFYIGNERRDVVLPKYRCLETHTGRRSFICNGLAKGIPVHVMMKWTGHKSYATMKPYIDAVRTVTMAEMKKFDEDV